MSKRTDLERQLEEVKLAETELTAALANPSPANAVKAKLWDEVYPIVKRAVEETVKGVPWNEKLIQIEMTEIVLRTVCGADVRKHLEKFK